MTSIERLERSLARRRNFQERITATLDDPRFTAPHDYLVRCLAANALDMEAMEQRIKYLNVRKLIADTRNDLIALRGDAHAYYARLRKFGAEIEAVTDLQVELMLLLAYDKFSTWKLDAGCTLELEK
jgi:hypothetical protein